MSMIGHNYLTWRTLLMQLIFLVVTFVYLSVIKILKVQKHIQLLKGICGYYVDQNRKLFFTNTKQ